MLITFKNKSYIDNIFTNKIEKIAHDIAAINSNNKLWLSCSKLTQALSFDIFSTL